MTRLLVAFQAPSSVEATTYEERWDEFVSSLKAHSLQIVSDLDPVAELVLGGSTLEVFEAVTL